MPEVLDDAEETHTVTYADGMDGEEVFADQVHTVAKGSATPSYLGTPARAGYLFRGWSPQIIAIVRQDITYVAQWERAYLSVYDLAGVYSAINRTDGLGTITGRIARYERLPEDPKDAVPGATIIVYEYDGNWPPVWKRVGTRHFRYK